MSQNKEDLKNKIIYRASYRGTKEMDILMSRFVNSLIDKLKTDELKDLDLLVNLDDINLKKIKNKESINKTIDSNLIKKFIDFDF
tara:strand:- start:812 stop:1066 length:255 start_codon:yes stop_codon:yes gene_type:complete